LLFNLVNQRLELDAREIILKEMFYKSQVLNQILLDASQGVPTIQKILSAACISQEERIRLADCVKAALASMNNIDEHHVAYKRLFDELSGIPVGSEDHRHSHPSPARTTKEPEMKAYASVFYPDLPTPTQSPARKTTLDPSATSFGTDHPRRK
jgi:hypothetical protein